jgi:OmpA-OmpF porin, OOP family
MRNLAIAIALASTAMASPALARNDAWYIGVEGGPSIVEDGALKITGAMAASSGTATVDHKTGYDFDGIIGYDFGGFRLEAEVGYKKASINNYTSTTTTAVRGNAAGLVVNAPAGAYNYAGGH